MFMYDDLNSYIFGLGALAIFVYLLLFIITIAFIKWIIKSSVKKAMYDVFCDEIMYDNLCKAISYSILNANARIEYEKKMEQNNERPTE